MTARFALSVIVLALGLTSCGGSGQSVGRFAYLLNVTGLPDSTTQTGHYEGWAIVNGTARTTGKFVVDGTGPGAVVRSPQRDRVYGTAAEAEFGPSITLLGQDFPLLQESTHIFITLEPEGDHDRVPSCQVILAGTLMNDSAILVPFGTPIDPTFDCALSDGQGGATLGLPNLAAASGSVELRTPTDDQSNPVPNDHAGLWFTNGGVPSLALPTLPGTLTYEAHVVIDGETRSLGRFKNGARRDDDFATAEQRGPDGPGFEAPGGDFVTPTNPPFAFDPPRTDLTSAQNFSSGDFRVLVSVEPQPDNDVAPFGLGLLSAFIPPTAVFSGGSGFSEIVMTSQFSEFPAANLVLTASSVVLSDLRLPMSAAAGTQPNDRRGHYELFAVLGGQDVSLARFLVVGTNIVELGTLATIGTMMQVVFDANTTANPGFPDPSMATSLFISFEDEADMDPLTSGRVLLQGSPVGGLATMSVVGRSATGGRGLADFSFAAGTFQLDTPTNDLPGVSEDDQFGLLFRRAGIVLDSNATSLTLPALPSGFVYEAFVENRLTGRMLSVGRFADASHSDQNDAASRSRGFERKPGFPGEDFLFDVPTVARLAAGPGSITQVFVTVEAVPDAEDGPSFLRVLQAAVPAGAAVGGVGGAPVALTNVFGNLGLGGQVSVIAD
ncbi:MAG: hypothetical protein KDB53_00330 [Planctomycetes bacterium]|nr:hypothetical protein [Planctomycetota bacterium]